MPSERMVTKTAVSRRNLQLCYAQTLYSLQGVIKFWLCQGLVKEREKKRKFALNHATLQSETCDGRPVPFLSLKRTLAMVFFREVQNYGKKK